MKNKPITIEDLVLAYRHLYYNGDAAIGDFEYDKLERAAMELLPESSPVHSVGSYSENPRIKDLARKLKSGQYKLDKLTFFAQ